MCIIQTVTTDTNGMYFFTIDRLNMQLISKIRYDLLPGAWTPNIIAFYENKDLDYFTYVRNVPAFSSATTNEILINRKALLYSDDNKFDCRPSNVLEVDDIDIAKDSYGGAECEFTVGSAAPANEWILEFTNPVAPDNRLFFLADLYFEYSIMNSPFVSSIYMQDSEMSKVFPQQWA